jgi:hypothetical protein
MQKGGRRVTKGEENMAAAADYSSRPGSGIDLVVEVRGVEQGNRPVSVSFPAITVKPESDRGALVSFEGPYEVFSPPASKGIDMAVEAPIFLGLIAHVFAPAEGLFQPRKGRAVPTIWDIAGFETTSTVTTRFFGYKAGSKRSPAQVGLSQLTGSMKGSSHAATQVSVNMHVWNAPDFALTFQDAKVTIRPAGYGRLALNAEYAWNQGEWTAKTSGLLVLDGNPHSLAHEGAALNTVLKLTLKERVSDNKDGVLAGTVSGKILRSK